MTRDGSLAAAERYARAGLLCLHGETVVELLARTAALHELSAAEAELLAERLRHPRSERPR